MKQDQIQRAVDFLRAGQLVAFPTETVYGLGADAASPTAVQRLYAAKGRPSSHPVIVHIGDASKLSNWVREIAPAASELARRFWPGPLTMVLPRAKQVLDSVTGGQDSVAIRVPAHPLAQALLRAFGGGVVAPSANRFGRVSPTTAAHVRSEFGDEIAMVLDGGPCRVGIESTIVDLTGDVPRLLRAGDIDPAQLAEVLGMLPQRPGTDAPRAPGMLARHYAPRTASWMVGSAALGEALREQTGKRVGILLCGSANAKAVFGAQLEQLAAEPRLYAQALYAALRRLDIAGLDAILVEQPPENAHWDAVWDRLRRATTPWPA